MKQEKILLQFISSIEDFYTIQSLLQNMFVDFKIFNKSIKLFDHVIDDFIESVLDFLNIPTEESSNEYIEHNWTRNVCKSLIINAALHPDLKQSAAELVIDWKNLHENTTRVSNHSSISYLEVLEKHQTGSSE